MDAIISRFPNFKTGLMTPLTLAVLVWFALLNTSITLLEKQPWLGMHYSENADAKGIVVDKQFRREATISVGDVLVSIESQAQPTIPLGRMSIIQEPDNYETYDAFDQVFEHNQRLFTLLQSGSVTVFTQNQQAHRITPTRRPLSSFPLDFWIMNFTALIVLMVGVGIWQSQKTLVTRIVLLGSIAYGCGMMSLAVTSSRGFGLDPQTFFMLASIDRLGKILFAYALVGLLMIYPRKIVPTWLVLVFFAFAPLIWLNEFFRWIEPPLHPFAGPIVLTAPLTAIVFGVWQRVLAHRRPADRATLKWYALSIWAAFLCSLVIYTIPHLTGQSPIGALWITSVLACLIYVGFALGVARYKLFRIDQIWLKAWLWVIAGAIIVLIDISLIAIFNLKQFTSLNIAIIIVAWIYFPARQWLWGKLATAPEPNLEQFLPEMAKAVFRQPSIHHSEQTWATILSKAFNALSAKTRDGQIKAIELVNNGEQLSVPSLNGLKHTLLMGRSQGTRLFSPTDVKLASALFALLKQLRDVRLAYDQGAEEERTRMMRDLHDDIGANLLSMVYDATSPEQAAYARETLVLLRETIHAVQRTSNIQLGEQIHQWQTQIRHRLALANIQLEWKDKLFTTQTEISPTLSLNLSRMLKEVINNILKHSAATWVKVFISSNESTLLIDICHNGHSQPISSWVEGEGLGNIKNRLIKHQAEITWQEKCLTHPEKSELQARITIPLSHLNQQNVDETSARAAKSAVN